MLTRIQAANGWKGVRFRDWRGDAAKMPGYVKDIIAELKALDDSI